MPETPEQKKHPGIEMKVLGIYIHPTRNTPVVFIGDEGEQFVMMVWVGFLEAQAILFGLKRAIAPPRPLTIDLLAGLLVEELGATVVTSSIVTIKEGTYYATVEIIDKEGKQVIRDARPSDAIALALRVQAPIRISEAVRGTVAEESENAKALLDFLRLEQEDNLNIQADTSLESIEG